MDNQGKRTGEGKVETHTARPKENYQKSKIDAVIEKTKKDVKNALNKK